MLYKLLKGLADNKDADQAVEDEVGLVNKIMYELEQKDGPLDMFVCKVVEEIMEKNHIQFADNDIKRDLVIH